MTAETDLPINDAVPAPTKIEPGNQFLWNWRQMQVYAQACVAHATAAKDAEIEALRTRLEDTVRDSTNKIEALRAEVERLTFEMGRLRQQYDERTACMIVHRGSALACSDAVRAAYSEEHERAERLAEALRDAREALADATNTMYGICGESQFCDSCSAFERANQWRQDWHGGDPLLQQITAALEQESNDA